MLDAGLFEYSSMRIILTKPYKLTINNSYSAVFLRIDFKVAEMLSAHNQFTINILFGLGLLNWVHILRSELEP